jgi:hypothetical protein
MSFIPQTSELLKELQELVQAHRKIFKQERVYRRVWVLLMGELLVFARHTVTQILMSLGLVEEDWSNWYRLFSQGRFSYEKASEVLFAETLKHVGEEEVYVMAGDSTQTRRSSQKMEGVGWLHNPQSPVFKRGIHLAQRWFNGSWLMPAEEGYSRAVPIKWLPAFTEKSKPKQVKPCKEWEAAVACLQWIRQQLNRHGRATQKLLMVGDGHYDTVDLWKHLPEDVWLLARSAKNRALYHFPKPTDRKNRKYGERAPTPQACWQQRQGWRVLEILVRGKLRHLQVKVEGPFLRRGAPDRPLFLIVVRGKKNKTRRRDPLPFLINAALDEHGQWQLPLPVSDLLFWAWQRWEIEVAHRELKSNFGLGQKQCWHPQAAILSVQWSAWVYALLLLAGYRAWGLTNSPQVPTRWWRGSKRWSLNTLWRGYRSAFWGAHQFTPVIPYSFITGEDWAPFDPLLRHPAFASARS